MSIAQLRETFETTGADARAGYTKEFETELDALFEKLTRCYNRLDEAATSLPKDDKRCSWVESFLYYAFNALFVSVHLLMSGLTISSGHMMRHFGEGLAMAMLCSHRGIRTYANFERDPERFPIQRVLGELLRKDNRAKLGIDGNAYQQFKEMVEWYDKLSHPTPLAVSTLYIFALSAGTRQIGGEFDQEKVEVIRGELRRAVSACDLLENAIIAATVHLHEST